MPLLPPDPHHHTESVVNIARHLSEHPTDATAREVYADALSDAGAEHHSTLHRFIAKRDKDSWDALVTHHGGDHSAAALEVTSEVHSHSRDMYPWAASRGQSGDPEHPAGMVANARAYAMSAWAGAGGKRYVRQAHGTAAEAHLEASNFHREVDKDPANSDHVHEQHELGPGDSWPDRWTNEVRASHSHAALLHEAAYHAHKFARIAHGWKPGTSRNT